MIAIRLTVISYQAAPQLSDYLVALFEEHGNMVNVASHLGLPDQMLHSHIG